MAHADLDALLNALLPFAKQMLERRGEFCPFGATMTSGGEIVAHGADAGKERPMSQELIDVLMQAFRRQAWAGEVRAIGICMDVKTIPPGQSEKTDAVCVCLEHHTGEAVEVFVPYRKGWLGRVQYGELFATPHAAEVFV